MHHLHLPNTEPHSNSTPHLPGSQDSATTGPTSEKPRPPHRTPPQLTHVQEGNKSTATSTNRLPPTNKNTTDHPPPPKSPMSKPYYRASLLTHLCQPTNTAAAFQTNHIRKSVHTDDLNQTPTPISPQPPNVTAPQQKHKHHTARTSILSPPPTKRASHGATAAPLNSANRMTHRPS